MNTACGARHGLSAKMYRLGATGEIVLPQLRRPVASLLIREGMDFLCRQSHAASRPVGVLRGPKSDQDTAVGVNVWDMHGLSPHYEFRKQHGTGTMKPRHSAP